MLSYRRLATTAAIALVFAATGCTDNNPGFGGWDVGEDAGADGSDDVSTDTQGEDSESDISPSCGELDSEASCNPVDGCVWGPVSCDPDGSAVMGCYEGHLAGAIDCRACIDISDQTICDSRPSCTWRERVCDGEVLEEGCFGADSVPLPACPDIDPATCPDREDCPSSVCEVLHPGCGPTLEGGLELTEELCAPSVSCESDADCPGDLRCADVMVNPCHDSPGTACGSLVKKCVPPDMLPEKTGCEGLVPEECHANQDCAAIYPAQCNREVPEGVVAYDEFKCLPHVAQHTDSVCEPGLSDCPDGYECGQVWAGCPSDHDCFVCASAAEVCLPK